MATQNWSTSNYLTVNSTLVTAYPFTMACWFNSNNATTGQNLVYFNTAINNISAGLSIEGTTGGDPVAANISDTPGGNNVAASTSSGYSINTWHHACGVFSSSTLRTAYIDGGSAGTNTTSRSAGAYARTSIGVYRTGSAFSAISGYLAEVCIWTAALDAAEVASLGKGVSPMLVRPQSLVHYLPMIRTAAQDLKGTTWTTTGSVNALGEHPRMYYSADMFARGTSAGASAFKAWLAAQSTQLAGAQYA